MATQQHWQFHSADRFADFASVWDELNARSHGSVLLGATFVSLCLKYFSTGRERIALCHDVDGRLAAAAVLTRQNAIAWHTFQASQAPLGIWLQARDGDLLQLLNSLVRALGSTGLMTSLTQCDPYLYPVPLDQPYVRVDPYIETARITVAGTWDEYWLARGQNLRNNLRKAKRKAADAGLSIAVHRIDEPQRMAQIVGSYGDIEALSWKSELGTAVTRGNVQGRFYAELMQTLASIGRARAYVLELGGQTAALDLCVTDPEQLVILKTTYDTRFKEMSPAFILRESSFKALFDSGEIRRIEFYGKVMDWHRRWSDESRTLYHLSRYRSGLLRIAHERAKRLAAGTRRIVPAIEPD
jgi:CelD/BcsL family acetyltransferase involved in cellulose biosynthesis